MPLIQLASQRQLQFRLSYFKANDTTFCPNIDNLVAGSYRVTVTDAAGCMLVDSARQVAPPLTVSADYLAETCTGPGTGRLTSAVAAGGGGDYRYAATGRRRGA